MHDKIPKNIKIVVKIIPQRSDITSNMDAREAVMSNNLSKLKELHSAGVNVDFKDEDERTPLHWAACLGSVSIVEFLLNVAKVRMNVQDDAGWTPLMSAASAGHIEIVSMLLCQYVTFMLSRCCYLMICCLLVEQTQTLLITTINYHFIFIKV